jgi:uncharacterized protein (TIGR02246 family)
VGIGQAEASALFDRRCRAWSAEDVEGYLACFADDVVLSVPGRSEPIRGRATYERVVRTAFRWAAPVAFDVDHLAVTPGGTVLAEWTITVRPRDGGADVSWRGMSTCGLQDGRITWWREHWDPAQLGRG